MAVLRPRALTALKHSLELFLRAGGTVYSDGFTGWDNMRLCDLGS